MTVIFLAKNLCVISETLFALLNKFDEKIYLTLYSSTMPSVVVKNVTYYQ